MRTAVKLVWQLLDREFTKTLHSSWKEFGMRLVTAMYQQKDRTSPALIRKRERRAASFQSKWRRLSDRLRPLAQSDPTVETIPSPPPEVEEIEQTKPQPLTFHHSLGGQEEGPLRLPQPRRASFSSSPSATLYFLRSEKAARHIAAAKYSLQNGRTEEWETLIAQVHEKLRSTAAFNFLNGLGR